MKTLLKNGKIVNVFSKEIEEANILIENGAIIGVGNYTDDDADFCDDMEGKYLAPGFIDGHMHIESTLLTPYELSKICIPHGTTAIVTDPHEIANVCGTAGIKYMMELSKDLPMKVYFTLSSCVPSTPFDESGAVLLPEDLEEFFDKENVVGLAEVMDYPGVVKGRPAFKEKIGMALRRNKVVDGHAPLLSGKDLDKYVAAGINSDHECTKLDEAMEKLKKGQWIMIRYGSAAKNMEALLPLFDQPYSSRCLLVSDDKYPEDIIKEGHIDTIIRLAVKHGKSPIECIAMATINAASRFNLAGVGAIAPGYRADIVVMNDLENVDICQVYCAGEKTFSNNRMADFPKPEANEVLSDLVRASFNVERLRNSDFYLEEKSEFCRVIELIPGELLTKERILEINWDINNGIDISRDILKLAVIERHRNTGHKGIGFIKGVKLMTGAIASSISHDAHNIIVIGTNDEDMAVAANHLRMCGGGCVVVVGGTVIASMPLSIAGLMSDLPAPEVASQHQLLNETLRSIGVPYNISPFMNMEFLSLTVIPELKMTTKGLVNVDRQEYVSLYVKK